MEPTPPKKMKNEPNFRVTTPTRDALAAILEEAKSGLSLTEFINTALLEVAAQINSPAEDIPMLPVVALMRNATGKRSLQQEAGAIASSYAKRFQDLEARLAAIEAGRILTIMSPPREESKAAEPKS